VIVKQKIYKRSTNHYCPEAIEKKGWRMHCGAEVTESSTNKQHHLKPYSTVHSPTRLRISESRESEREREREREVRERELY
jgi:hypothetical protein